MGHKVLIGGTAYDIKGGKTLIGGTAYDIKGGKTLIDGTGYDISFGGAVPTIAELMADATLLVSAGRNSRSSGTVSIAKADVPTGTSYLFSFCYGYLSIYKVTKDSSSADPELTLLNESTTNYGHARVNNSGGIYYSSTGSSNTSVYGATLALFQFGGYTEQQIDACLSAVTLAHKGGRNSSSTSTVQAMSGWPGYFFGAYSTYLEFSYVSSGGTKTVIYNNTIVLQYTNHLLKLIAGVYGGSIVQVS